jgi:phosphatidylserine/phosphatidylglycerophosphate/cardiolipin synthase-like enzyme
MMAADGKRCIVGSINLAPGSFDTRRELAIIADDDKVMKKLGEVIENDWQHSKPLDLSDEGLLADLKDRDPEAAAKLALTDGSGDGHGHGKHHKH